ncbi:MAG: HNH endonuclease [Planctomycetaceae bacterium]|nr:HNH endonuclease [Planctomycetaceae bacterium]
MQVSVLALNRHYVAVHVLPVQRAFSLLWKGSAEVVNVEQNQFLSYDFDGWREISQLKANLEERDDTDDWIRTVRFEIQVPRIVRLLRYDRVPRNVVKFSRRNIFLRDGHCCQYCDGRFPRHLLSLDHVVPRSRGGGDSWENVVCACLACNVRKGGRTPQEAGMALKSPPVRPKRNPLISHQLAQQKYASWGKFVWMSE